MADLLAALTRVRKGQMKTSQMRARRITFEVRWGKLYRAVDRGEWQRIATGPKEFRLVFRNGKLELKSASCMRDIEHKPISTPTTDMESEFDRSGPQCGNQFLRQAISQVRNKLTA